MSTREAAINLVDRLDEKRLEMFIELFGQFAGERSDADEDMRKKREAFDYIVSHRKPYVGGDYKEELAQARDERYGV